MSMLAPNGKPLAYMTLNANLKSLLEILEKNEDFNIAMNQLAEQTGMTKSELQTIVL